MSHYVLRITDGVVAEQSFEAVHALVEDVGGWALITKDDPMTMWHLANMVSGYTRAEAPGARWAYNDYAIKLYARTMRDVFGGGATDLNTAATSRLSALQLGSGIFTSQDSNRLNLGLLMTPRDMARLGWWVMNDGDWNGTQILPANWFTDYFGVAQVAGSLPRTSGTNGSGEYLGVGTMGGGGDDIPGIPGLYGYNQWFNELQGETGIRGWPDCPTDMRGWLGHDGMPGEIMVLLPTQQMVIAAEGDWGDWADFTNANASFNNNVAALVAGVTGEGSISPVFPGSSWATATDAEAGLGTTPLNTFISTLGGSGVIIRKGYQVRTWGSATDQIEWASACKPMISIMLAFAIVEELIT